MTSTEIARITNAHIFSKFVFILSLKVKLITSGLHISAGACESQNHAVVSSDEKLDLVLESSSNSRAEGRCLIE